MVSLQIGNLGDNEVEVLLNAYNSDEMISEDKNHTSDDSFYATSDSDDENSDMEMERDNVKIVQTKDGGITLSKIPFPNKGKHPVKT